MWLRGFGGLVLELLAVTAHAWQAEMRAAAQGATSARGVAVDAAGDAVVIGNARFEAFKVEGTSGRILWRQRVPNVWDVALDPAGDVAIVGFDFHVRKLAGSDGTTLWETTPFPTAGGLAVVADSAGDIIAGGLGTAQEFAVAKLDGTNGTVLWTYSMAAPPEGQVWSLAVDAADNVLAGGIAIVPLVSGDSTVVKLAAASGAELWRYQMPGNALVSLTLDASGDVIAGGQSDTPLPFLVAKIAGATGAEIWRYETMGFLAVQVGVDATGDVFATGQLDSTTSIVKVDGASGAEIWRSGLGGPGELGAGVGVDAAGDALIATSLFGEMAVFKVAGATGTVLWQQVLRGRAPTGTGNGAGGLALDGADDPIAIGQLENNPSSSASSIDLAVVKLGNVDGSDLVAGKSLSLSDPADPSGRRLDVRSRRAIGIAPQTDSDPTTGGAVLEVRNPLSAETGTFSLPAAGWTTIASTTKVRGYRFDDPGGPCPRAILKVNRLKVTCDDLGGLSLDEALQGSLSVRLTTGTGTGARRYCMSFGGTIQSDKPGLFRANNAAAPAACPFP